MPEDNQKLLSLVMADKCLEGLKEFIIRCHRTAPDMSRTLEVIRGELFLKVDVLKEMGMHVEDLRREVTEAHLPSDFYEVADRMQSMIARLLPVYTSRTGRAIA